MSLSKRPVSLEDILRLKRAERPPAEFWEQFDRELRAKQLAALVEKRPWWQFLPHVFAGLRRYHLPLGATAVLAITFVSIREFQSAGNPAATAPSRAIAAVSQRAGVAGATVAAADTNAARLAPVAALASADENASAAPADSATDVFARADAAPAEFAGTIPLFGAGSQSPATLTNTPSARAIAANFAAAQAAPIVTRAALLVRPANFETRAMPASRTPVEPLAQITPPAESRRARLLAAIVSTTSYNTEAPFRNGERLASRVSQAQERLYDEVHRFGASGNSLSMKF